MELPLTPRSEKPLFLCATCGACYCIEHARDHHYSKSHGGAALGRSPADSASPGGSGGPNDCCSRYPYHTMFFGVPSFISADPAHLLEESEWGLTLPMVVVQELQDGRLSLEQPYPFYNNFDMLADEAPYTFASSGASSLECRRTGGGPSSTAPTRTPLSCSNHSSRVASFDLSTARHALPPPRFYSNHHWNCLVWCARCSERTLRISCRLDDSEPSMRHVRRLGQMLALLAYFRRFGVRLELPSAYIAYDEYKKNIQSQQQKGLRIKAISAVESQRVSKSTEDAPLTIKAPGSAVESPRSNRSRSTLVKIEMDQILSNAGICGFANPSFFCYMNSVVQCVLRCGFFTRRLLQLSPIDAPGHLSQAMVSLIHHVHNQTYQDVRNAAVNPYMKALYKQVCKVCPIFEEDEQQDAQELLLTLINGIADEFDKGKSKEEKEQLPRLSFEGNLRTEVRCNSCDQRVPHDEMFIALSVPVKHSIHEGLEEVFKPDHLQGKDRYACESCFKRLSRKEQEYHNETVRVHQEDRKRRKERGEKVVDDHAEQSNTKDCVYSDAEVRRCFTRLGGTLAIHLLRFQYDPKVQDTVKVTSPVAIPVSIDLSPYVSEEVRKQYHAYDLIRTLQLRFPGVEKCILEKYLRKCKDSCEDATHRLLRDGYGLEGAEESSVVNMSRRSVSGIGDDSVRSLESPVENGLITPFHMPANRSTSNLSHNTAHTAHNHLHHNNNNNNTNGFATAASVHGNRPTQVSRTTVPSPAPSSAEAALSITADEFDPFGERRASSPSLSRQLVGIVTHRGSLHGGHYIAYVRHLAKPQVWFRCDDEQVDVVEESTVLSYTSEVYLAFYE